MSIGRGHRLMEEMMRLSVRIGREVKYCVVTNERGLIVASTGSIGPFEERLAAMASLLAETGKRVVSTVELGVLSHASVATLDDTLIMYEFPVRGRPFRMVVVIPTRETRRGGLLRIFRSRIDMETGLAQTIESVKKILEE